MRGRDLTEGADYGVQGSYFGRFRMLRLEQPGWGGPRQVRMQKVADETGEPTDASPVLIRPQEIVAPWEQFHAEREARVRQEAADRELHGRVGAELTARGIGWSCGEWRDGAFLISLPARDLSALLGLEEDCSAIEQVLGETESRAGR